MDITDKEAVKNVITGTNPDAVIHCSAWIAVDMIEDDNKVVLVREVSVGGTQNIVDVCKKLDCKMTYIVQTMCLMVREQNTWKQDYKDYKPLNVYSQTKLEGELAVVSTLEKYNTVRIAWVFGLNSKNFIKAMINIGKTHDTVRMVYDQIGTPTCTLNLIRLLLESDFTPFPTW